MSDFIYRHIGPNLNEQQQMLAAVGSSNLDAFISSVIPAQLLSHTPTTNECGLSEEKAQAELASILADNQVLKNYIGLGYHDTITPAVIRRNVLENPGWYTAYTPYQAEIAQGRLQALLNFQQMVIDLTGLELANASLLDEATAAAEAMAMARRINPNAPANFFVANDVLPQTLSVLQTRAEYLGYNLIIGNFNDCQPQQVFGVLLQNPGLHGELRDYSQLIKDWKIQQQQLVVTLVCDILSLVMFKSAASQGAEIAVGSTQRFGIPLGFGGPAAAYMATKDVHKRLMPGRIIGVSLDSRGKKALRMSLQTREQHIRREKATSNICTSQVLLANMAGFYAVYHGAEGLSQIAHRICYLANLLAVNLRQAGIELSGNGPYFDSFSFKVANPEQLQAKLNEHGYALGQIGNMMLLAVGESATLAEIEELAQLISGRKLNLIPEPQLLAALTPFYREDEILTHAVFNDYRTETKLMRYLKRLENYDISLVHSMIPLGSCTMKLNSAAELEPVSWAKVANIHPFAPRTSVGGYLKFLSNFKQRLRQITGFSEICLQPNSGAQGEYSGLLAIRRYFQSLGQAKRNICLIPKSAHGTNPATAQMMGMEVVVVNCDSDGNVDIADLTNKAQQYQSELACLMITYPSTHGVFEAGIGEICAIIHQYGGQVYMDGANLNALVGLVKPAELGADVMHMNLHKTFAIPHGGGGPGMGPIGVAQHLAPFLPQHPLVNDGDTPDSTNTAVASAPFGSASILTISWMYIRLLGEVGLAQATRIAILNANYLACALTKVGYSVLYHGQNGRVAHECIIDLRPLKAASGITEVDFAKRLMDYGFHAPTMSFPVPGTLMLEPTESESKDELDRFIAALTAIYHEVQQVITGAWERNNNPLKNAPHTLADIMTWDKPYSIELGCFPLAYLRDGKIFPSVNRIDDAHGDRNFMCSCFDFN